MRPHSGDSPHKKGRNKNNGLPTQRPPIFNRNTTDNPTVMIDTVLNASEKNLVFLFIA